MQITLRLSIRQIIDIEQLTAAHARDLAELFEADPSEQIRAAIARLKETQEACAAVLR
jgi:hypothetical protein